MKKERILIVDDEPAIRALVEQVVKESGYNVDSSSDAVSAMDMMSKAEYSLAVCDIRMPGKDGIWLLKEIKKRYPDTQVIILTGSDNLHDAVASLNIGAENYILKPPNIDEVSQLVEKAIEKRRLINRDRTRKIWTERKLQEQERRIKELFLGSMEALTTSLEAKDKYTRGHSERVVKLSVSFVEIIGLKREWFEKLEIASSLHDIGKIGIRETILNKPGRLTEEEYAHIKKHSALGEHIIKPLIQDEDITQGIRHHHERFDGKGYPDGLAKDKIPLAGRMIALADAFDAMTSTRPYRKAYSKDEAREKIEWNAGKQFDPEMVKEFLKMTEEGQNVITDKILAADDERPVRTLAHRL